MTESTNLTRKTKATKSKSSLFSSLTMHPDKEVQFRAEAKELSHRKFYASTEERKSLIKEVKDAGFLLYEYYLMLAGVRSSDEITDEGTAKHFGWDVSKAKRIRLSLVKAGWFHQESYTYSRGRKGITYYIGKGQVSAHHAAQTGAIGIP